jgi:hypothetical protein
MTFMKSILYSFFLTLCTNSLVSAQQPAIPEPRWVPQIAYDDANSQVLLFGGSTKNKVLDDLWALKGNTWEKLSDSGPPPRCKTFLVYDKQRKVALLFGGQDSKYKPMGDTWEWDGTKWEQKMTDAPPARAHSMAAYDEINREIILFGGYGEKGLLRDTWSYDGTTWKLRNADGPQNCLPHGIFYNSKLKSVVMVTLSRELNPADSLFPNRMWVWKGNAWQVLSNSTPSTSKQGLQSLAMLKNDIVLYEGDNAIDNISLTWIFSKNKWQSKRTPGPSPRVGAAMIYDNKRKKTILFGGNNRKIVFNDTWEWDGVKWSEVKQ